MNTVTPEKKDAVLKTLAIIGFFAIIILITLASIRLVHSLPSAFSSLASLAEGVNKYQQSIIDIDPEIPFTVTSESSLVTAGETVTLTWESVRGESSFAFQYACADGVAIEILTETEQIAVSCGTYYDVGSATSLDLVVMSEKHRYTDLTYTIGVVRPTETEPSTVAKANFTVVNASVAALASAEIVPGTETGTSTEPAEESTLVSEPGQVLGETANETPSVDAPVPTENTPQFEFTYAVPTSDPNGRTDLNVRFIGTGKIIGDTFFAEPLRRGERGAIQFEVRNIGTKTSGDWTYQTALPGDIDISSPDQTPLKPNERAIITLGFPEMNTTSYTFTITAVTSDDRNRNNNVVSKTETVR